MRLTAGQLAALPGGVPHSATVPASEGAVSLNVFTYRERPPEAFASSHTDQETSR